MTDAEIIKALEVISTTANCGECAFYSGKVCSCSQVTAKYSLDLINRQKAEIVRLKSMNQAKLDMIHDLRTDLETANAEIERLQKDLGIWKDIAHRETRYVDIAKAESIKEFAKRLKLHSYIVSDESKSGIVNRYSVVTANQIDHLIKEMTGDPNAKV